MAHMEESCPDHLGGCSLLMEMQKSVTWLHRDVRGQKNPSRAHGLWEYLHSQPQLKKNGSNVGLVGGRGAGSQPQQNTTKKLLSSPKDDKGLWHSWILDSISTFLMLLKCHLYKRKYSGTFKVSNHFGSPKSLVCLMEVASNSPIPHWLTDTGDFAPPHRLHQAAVGSAEFFLVSCTHSVGV